MLDEICDAAKQEMRDMKENALGLWQNTVTVADDTWLAQQKCHVYNKKSPERCLYYHHLYQKGRDEVSEEELYRGTSKSGGRFLGPSYISEGQRGGNARCHPVARCRLLLSQGSQGSVS